MYKNFQIYSITIALSTMLSTTLGCGGYNLSQSGKSTTYVSLKFEFIDQLKELCQDTHIQKDYQTLELYNKAVGDCVFDHLSSVGVAAPTIKSFQEQHCVDPIASEFVTACQVLNGGV